MHYDPKAEIALIQKPLMLISILSKVCLKAQLLSVAYGGKYEHSPERENWRFPFDPN